MRSEQHRFSYYSSASSDPHFFAAFDLSAANKRHNFKSIAFGNPRGRPLASRKDFKISLDRNSIRSQFQMFQKPGDIEPFGNFLGIAVDGNAHAGDCFADALLNASE